MKTYAYYPGCSIKGTAKHYEESLFKVFNLLGVELKEIEDWNCCGATLYMSMDETQSFSLSARNLALAAEMNLEMVAPCSACYMILLKTQDYCRRYPEIRDRVQQALTQANLSYPDGISVRHPLDILINEIGPAEIERRVRRPLISFKVAPYYGCLLVRPYSSFDHCFFPETLDRLFALTGATVIDYPLKTRCCGGSLTGTIEEVGLRLNYILLKEAVKRGANIMVTTCPLCQFNLESYQKKIRKKYPDLEPLPVVYFTQLLGLALGIPARELGFQRLFTPTDHLLKTLPAATSPENVST